MKACFIVRNWYLEFSDPQCFHVNARQTGFVNYTPSPALFLRRHLLFGIGFACALHRWRMLACRRGVARGDLLSQFGHQLRMLLEIISRLFAALAELHVSVTEPG